MPACHHKVAIPFPILEMCTRDVLVMEFLHGIRLVDGIRNSYRKVAEQMGTTLEALEEEQKEKIKHGELKSAENEKTRIKWLRVGLRAHDYFYNILKFFL